MGDRFWVAPNERGRPRKERPSSDMIALLAPTR